MAVRPPADAVVTLRSLGRRFRAALAGRGEDERPEDLAHRVGQDGRSALDHVVHATRTITLLGRALDQTLREEDPVLHPAAVDATQREWGDTTSGTVDELVSELAWEADALADRVEHVPAADWGRHARVAGADATVSALALLWDAADSAITDLRAVERTLEALRGRP